MVPAKNGYTRVALAKLMTQSSITRSRARVTTAFSVGQTKIAVSLASSHFSVDPAKVPLLLEGLKMRNAEHFR